MDLSARPWRAHAVTLGFVPGRVRCQRGGIAGQVVQKERVIPEITELLDGCRNGDVACFDAVFVELHDELRKIAVGKLDGPRRGETLTPTVLVHEAYVRLVSGKPLDVESRRHFFTSAARAMRHIMVDRARRASAEKRGGARHRITWTERLIESVSRDAELLDLDRALGELASISERGRTVVELRFFAGLSAQETADVLDVSLRTVHREWRQARAFLHARLGEAATEGGAS